ncbi:MAG: ABC transporter permease [Acidobacteriaceae bacterium]
MNWLKRSFSRRHRYDELSESIREHLDEKIADLMDRGMTRDQAEQTARREFGNVTRIEERSREVWQWPRLDSLWSDIRFALRQLWKSPAPTVVSVLSLALGIGATSAIFSVVYCVVLRPLPYAGASRMVHLDMFDRSGNLGYAQLSGEQFAQLRHVKALDGAIADDQWEMTITSKGLPQPVQADQLSSNAFRFFGIPPLLGRGFTEADAPLGEEPAHVAVISFRFWKSEYAGRPDVIGNVLQLNHKDFTIIGIMPKRFVWAGGGGQTPSDVYLPLKLSADQSLMYPITARLKPSVTAAVADAELKALYEQFMKDTPSRFVRDSTIQVIGLRQSVIGSIQGTLFILFGAVAALLAIGCINVGILLLARGTLRRSELAIRSALGAQRLRLIRQLLTESLVIAVAGGLAGIPLSFMGMALLMRWIPEGMLPAGQPVAMNLPVLLFSIAVALLTGVCCGLRPALDFSRQKSNLALTGSTRGTIGDTRNKYTHRVLVVGQVALSVLLMAAALAAVRTLARLKQTELGYSPKNLLFADLSLAEGSYQGWAQRITYYNQLLRKISELPGVRFAAFSLNGLPPESQSLTNFSTLDRPNPSEQSSSLEQVSRDYFVTLGIPLLQGEIWSEAEERHAAHVAVINEAMAHRYWPNGDAISHVIRIPDLAAKTAWVFNAPGNDGTVEIIGVVGNVPNNGLGEKPLPAVYAPYSLVAVDWLQLIVKTKAAPMAMVRGIREQVQSINDAQALNPTGTAEDHLIASGWGQVRFVASLFSILAVLALVLSSIGLYSVISYTVSQTTKELAIHLALGATRGRVLQRVVLSAGISIGMGLCLGSAACVALNRVVLHWTEANLATPTVLSASGVILGIVSLLAALPPALRAATIDPMQVLRGE